MSRPTLQPEKEAMSAQIAEATAAFLASGGQMQIIPNGASTDDLGNVQVWSRVSERDRLAKAEYKKSH